MANAHLKLSLQQLFLLGRLGQPLVVRLDVAFDGRNIVLFRTWACKKGKWQRSPLFPTHHIFTHSQTHTHAQTRTRAHTQHTHLPWPARQPVLQLRAASRLRVAGSAQVMRGSQKACRGIELTRKGFAGAALPLQPPCRCHGLLPRAADTQRPKGFTIKRASAFFTATTNRWFAPCFG